MGKKWERTNKKFKIENFSWMEKKNVEKIGEMIDGRSLDESSIVENYFEKKKNENEDRRKKVIRNFFIVLGLQEFRN